MQSFTGRWILTSTSLLLTLSIFNVLSTEERSYSLSLWALFCFLYYISYPICYDWLVTNRRKKNTFSRGLLVTTFVIVVMVRSHFSNIWWLPHMLRPAKQWPVWNVCVHIIHAYFVPERWPLGQYLKRWNPFVYISGKMHLSLSLSPSLPISLKNKTII